MSTPSDPSNYTEEERLYDDYLDAALRGEVESPDSFCRRHRGASPNLRRLLDGLHQMLVDSNTEPESTSGLPCEQLGDYRLVKRLGEGGMGVVYLAEQTRLRRGVAVKVLRPELAGSATAIARLEREARAIAKLAHPNIVTVFELGEVDGMRFLAMELVPGQSLDALIDTARASGTPIEVRRALQWVAQIAAALQCAHDAGVLHRDVKPSNIRITPDGDAKLLDFGLARDLLAIDDATITHAFAGSPAYCSPEQLAGDRTRIGPASDQYSLGVTAYETLSLDFPHAADTIEVLLQRIMSGYTRSLRQLDGSIARDIDTVVMKAIQRTPELRYSSVAAFAEDLQAVVELRPIRARPPGPFARALRWARLHRTATAILIAVTLALGAALATNWWSHARVDAANRRNAARLVAAAHAEIDAVVERRHAAGSAGVELEKLTRRARTGWLPPEDNERKLALELQLEDYWRGFEQANANIIDRMAQARRLAPGSEAIDEVWARFSYERWFSLRESKDNTRAVRLFRRLIDTFDDAGRWSAHADGVAQLSVETDPPGARVYLFRFVRLCDLRPDSNERRLVPAPLGVEPGWCGRPALRVERDHGEFAAGDLITAINSIAIEAVETDAAIPAGATALVRRDTSELDLVIPDGIELRRTHAPLDVAVATDLGVTPTQPRHLPSGSYLLLLRLADHEELRLPFHLPHQPDGEPNVMNLAARLLPSGSTLPGFVRVADPLNRMPSFWIMAREVTCGEYLHFLNDPTTRQEIDAAPTLIRVPRDIDTIARGGRWGRRSAGSFELPTTTSPQDPVLGISWSDARAYSLWMRRKHGDIELGEARFKFGFPTPSEWRRAAAGYRMGFDQRRYPFGDHWHAPFAKSRFSSPRVAPEPVLSYPVDESPYGVFDMAGSAAEWCEWFLDEAKQLRGLAGGSWLESEASAFRADRFRPADPDAANLAFGFRLVLRQRKERR